MSTVTAHIDIEKQLVPALRFKEFDGEWENISINELVSDDILEKPMDGNHGSIHPVAADFVKSGIPFIMANCFSKGKLIIEKAVCLRKEQADKLQKGFSISDDVLLTHKGAALGKTAIVPAITTEYIMLTPQVTYYRILNQDRLHNYYLKYFFDTWYYQKPFLILSDGGTRPYVGITMQRELNISLPILSEQQKVATFLGVVDEKIQQLIKKKELLKQYKNITDKLLKTN